MSVEFPPGYARTEPWKREHAPFKVTFDEARRATIARLRTMGATDLRIDVDEFERRDSDPGVVVRWKRGGRSYAMACDHWKTHAENMRAIGLTLDAKHGIERWGAATAEQEYRGYEALPPPRAAPTKRAPHEILHVAPGAPPEVVTAAFRALAMKLHPDKSTGDQEMMAEAIEARDALLAGRSP